MNGQGNSFEKFLDISTLSLEGDFDTQVHQLLSTIRLTRGEVENLTELVSDLTRTLSVSWPDCKIHPFGSIVMGLGIRSSDIDCFVALPPQATRNQKAIVNRARQLLMRERLKYAEVFCIPHAKVPIVKFYHLPTDRNCDVNFKSLAGVQNSRLLAYLLHVDPRALPLAILVKYWSKVHNLTGTNLVPNYAMTLMVVFYLQHVNILPPVHLLQQSANEYIVDHWNTGFAEIQFENDDNLSLYQLLGGFFEFYAGFDFEKKVVCPFLGCAIDKDCFVHDSQLPKEFGLYQAIVECNVFRKIRIDTAMCIQDPFEHCRNCAVAVNTKLFDNVMVNMNFAAQVFYEGHPDDYLKAIMAKSTISAVQPSTAINTEHKTPNKIEKRKKQDGVQHNINKNLHIIIDKFWKQKK